MCGIAVYAGARLDAGTRTVRRALGALQHRGPDDAGIALFDPRGPEGRLEDAQGRTRPWPLASMSGSDGVAAVLGVRRLAIIDPGPTGRQPMVSGDGRYAIAFNGEIYNHVELRAELAAHGRTFRGRSDTEVLLAAFAEWGAGCLDRLEGMYAFAVLDTLARELFVARDPFGMKPLYVVRSPEATLFASEIRAVMAGDQVSRRIDPARLDAYLRDGRTDDGPGTLFREVSAVPPGHAGTVPLARPEDTAFTSYWTPSTASISDLSFDEAAIRLRDLVAQSVALHLRSDVPVGVLLSGGTDSSTITALVREAKGPSFDLHTFSYVGGQGAPSEAAWFRAAAQAADALSHEVRVPPDTWVAESDRVTAAQGEPFGSLAVYVQHQLFGAAARAGIKVVLGGQGGDELFAGYATHRSLRVASLLRRGAVLRAARLLPAAAVRPGWRATVRTAIGTALPAWVKPSRPPPPWIRREWLDHNLPPRQRRPGLAGPDVLRAGLRRGLERTLPMLLRWEDRNSMDHAVEGRLPFVTRSVVEFVLQLPEEHLMDARGGGKRILRAAMRGLVPDEILDRRDKVGFAVPVHTWPLMIPEVEQRLRRAADIPAVSPAFVTRLADRVRRREPLDGPGTYLLWRLVGLADWDRLYRPDWD